MFTVFIIKGEIILTHQAFKKHIIKLNVFYAFNYVKLCIKIKELCQDLKHCRFSVYDSLQDVFSIAVSSNTEYHIIIINGDN